MPIVDAVDALIAGRADVDEVLEALLTRPPRSEGGLEIDRDALLFPIAEARRVELVLLAGGRRSSTAAGSGTGGDGLR